MIMKSEFCIEDQTEDCFHKITEREKKKKKKKETQSKCLLLKARKLSSPITRVSHDRITYIITRKFWHMLIHKSSSLSCTWQIYRQANEKKT